MKELQSMETSTILSCTEANDAYTKFISKYTEVFNNCFPFRNQTKKHKTKKAVWNDTELRETYKSKQLLYKKYMKKPSESIWSAVCAPKFVLCFFAFLIK